MTESASSTRPTTTALLKYFLSLGSLLIAAGAAAGLVIVSLR